MNLKFLKELQDLCEMAGLPTEVRILQQIINEKADFASQISRQKSLKKVEVRNIKVLCENEILDAVRNF